MNGKNEGGVKVPTEVVVKSDEIKQQHRSLRQTQIYRDISNLKYLTVKIMSDAPRRYAKYIDEVIMTVSNAKQSIILGMRVSNLIELQRIEQVLNSYLGFCRRRKTYRFRKRIIDGMGSGFWRCFNVRGHYESVRLKREYRLI